ncbi:MAG TPA: tetratricopeptide repeat protein [Thermoanaerobaculia bacterium]|nr:tetratricopeptide repeat protein [Thermoanaerobaculia bacterium]
MARTPAPATSEPQESRTGKRLESWKEIAAYFKRDVRTVKRWEKDEGLPVHRHLHKTLASVYAYEAELEEWSKNRQPRLEKSETAEPQPRRLGWPVRVVAAAVVVMVAAAAAYWLMRPSALAFQQRDWALIAQFENRTGEAVFDGTVEYALEREISNSRFVNVVPRERIGDSLRLMKKPPNTIVDQSIGREICLRDGEIRALITGRVEKLDNTYVLSASLVNPETGVTVASFSEQAVGQRETVSAIQRLSDRVREGLGEQLPSIGKGVEKLERVSTPSLRALQLYSHADGLIRMHQSDQAVELLREALQEDPQFASAHVLLAHSLSNIGRREEAGPHYQRAVELSKNSTDAERLFILASYYHLRDHRQAAQTLELLLRLYPDHYWAASNLAVTYHSLGQPQRALPYIVRRADLRSHNFDHQLRAAHALLVWGDSRKAEPYLERARRIIAAEEAGPFRAWRAAWVTLYPAQAAWIKGDLGGALAEVAEVAGQIDSTAEENRNALRWEVGSFYLNVGRERAARQFFQAMTGPPDYLALAGLGLDDQPTVRKYVQFAPASHRAAILMARAGLLAEAEKAIADPDTVRRAYAPFLPGVWDTLARGELALARGRTADAIPLLEGVVRKLRLWPTPYFFLGSEALARAWEQQGDVAKSLAVLEDASEYGPAAVFWGPAPLFWMKNELRRAELYRRLGRETDRQRVHAELARLLTHADPDFPILQQLRRSQAGGAPVSR